jgi:hypothetical protein
VPLIKKIRQKFNKIRINKIRVLIISFTIFFFLTSPFLVDAEVFESETGALKLGFGVGSDHFGLFGLNLSVGIKASHQFEDGFIFGPKIGDKLHFGLMFGLGWIFVSAKVPLPNGQIDTLRDSKSGFGTGVFLEYFHTEKLSFYFSIPYHLVDLKIPYEVKCEENFCSAKQTGKSEEIYGVDALFGINYYFLDHLFIKAGFGSRITPKIHLTFSLGFGLSSPLKKRTTIRRK